MTHDTDSPDEVTQSTVRLLWDRALETPGDLGSIHDHAEALLERVSSENPVVNGGLTALHSLTRPPGCSADKIREHRSAWLAEVERYEADPQGWMRRYFQAVVRDLTNHRGPERGARLASKLVQQGLLAPSDVPGETSENGS